MGEKGEEMLTDNLKATPDQASLTERQKTKNYSPRLKETLLFSNKEAMLKFIILPLLNTKWM